MVSEAKDPLIFLRVSDQSRRSALMVVSTRGRPFSEATTRPALTIPLSIILPTITMPLRNPRQAFETSKIMVSSPNCIFSWTKDAVAGSMYSR